MGKIIYKYISIYIYIYRKGTINPYQWRQLCSKVYHKKLEEDEDGVDVIKMQPVEGVKAPSKAPKSKVDQELLSKVNDIYHFYDKNGDGVLVDNMLDNSLFRIYLSSLRLVN